MSNKIDLSVKINNRELTKKEQLFINLWLKLLEYALENDAILDIVDVIKKGSLQLGIELSLRKWQNLK